MHYKKNKKQEKMFKIQENLVQGRACLSGGKTFSGPGTFLARDIKLVQLGKFSNLGNKCALTESG